MISFLYAAMLLAAAPPHFVEIKIPRGVDSSGVFIRYVIDHDFGGWVEPRAEVSSYFIDTTRDDREAGLFKALLYAPGCAIEAVDLAIEGTAVQQIPFACNRPPQVTIDATLDPAAARDTRMEIKYSAPWIDDFLGLGDRIVTGVPVASVTYHADNGRFHFTIPDLSKDLRASAGEFRIWAMAGDGTVFAQLIPRDRALSKNSGLKVAARYPSEISFAMCGTPQARPHDRFGFTLRTPGADPCP